MSISKHAELDDYRNLYNERMQAACVFLASLFDINSIGIEAGATELWPLRKNNVATRGVARA